MSYSAGVPPVIRPTPLDRSLATIAVGLSLLCLSAAPASAVLYWDLTAGAVGAGGPTPSGDWDTAAANWNAVADGSGAALVPWTPGEAAVFSAGSDATGAFTITLTAAQTASTITLEEGTISLMGAALGIGSGSVTIGTGAKLSIPATGNLTASAGATLNLNGGTFRSTANGVGLTFISGNFNINIGAAGGTLETANTGTNSSIYTGGIISGPGVLTKTGSGEFRYQGVGLPNTTFSKLVVAEGLFRLGFNSATSDERGFGAVPAAFTPDAITLMNGGSIGTSFLAVDSVLHVNRGVTLGTGGGAINGNMTIPGAITGPGSLSHLTTGQLVLGGNNTYTGATIHSNGTLVLRGSLTGTANVTVSGAGILGGAGTISPAAAGKLELLGGGKLSPGDITSAGAAVGTLSVVLNGGGAIDLSAGVTIASSQALVFQLATPAASDKITLSGGALNIGLGVLEFDDFAFTTTASLTEGDYLLFDGTAPIVGTLGSAVSGVVGGLNANLQFANGGTDLVLHVVPEPTAATLLLGSLGLVLNRRSRGRSVR